MPYGRPVKPVRCGDCGHTKFAVSVDDQNYPKRVEIECLKCHSVSSIDVKPVRMAVSGALFIDEDNAFTSGKKGE